MREGVLDRAYGKNDYIEVEKYYIEVGVVYCGWIKGLVGWNDKIRKGKLEIDCGRFRTFEWFGFFFNGEFLKGFFEEGRKMIWILEK